MKRTDVLNFLIEKKGYTSYLEIGIQTKEQNFNLIQAADKVGVDPNLDGVDYVMTSDAFFKQNKKKFDLIFIDGEHTATQSAKDFENAKKALNKGGCIVFHDAMPKNQEYAKPEWCGDVYKTCAKVAGEYFTRTYTQDHGVCVVFPDVESDQGGAEFISYPGLDLLNEALNSVNIFDDLLPSAAQLEEPAEDAAEDTLETMDFEELKSLYTEKTGKSYRGKTVEPLIKKIREA